MKIFLDSSVILSACGSKKSLSRLITEIAEDRGWNLVSAVYCRAETVKNLAKFSPQATAHWQNLQIVGGHLKCTTRGHFKMHHFSTV